MELTFWIFIATLLYSFFGYIILLVLISAVKTLPIKNKTIVNNHLPTITLFVAAYNEEKIIDEKIRNTFELDYPKDKIQYLWITDGSTDNTVSLLKKHPEIEVLHTPDRGGKSGAINRGMPYAKGDIVIFSDANSMLSKNAIREITGRFNHPKTGCVAGAKNIYHNDNTSQVGIGEFFYWKYENIIKSLESTVSSTVGAAGELFAIRRELFSPIPADAILDDFVITIQVILKGYKIDYAPKAMAYEAASASFKDEDKRKSRIAAGCMQTLIRYPVLLNPFRTGIFAFQYFSHKVIRWLFVPPILLSLPILILIISVQHQFQMPLYNVLLGVIVIFCMLLLLSFIPFIAKRKIKLFLLPEFLILMNISVLKGYFRFFKGNQSAIWEKVNRTYS